MSRSPALRSLITAALPLACCGPLEDPLAVAPHPRAAIANYSDEFSASSLRSGWVVLNPAQLSYSLSGGQLHMEPEVNTVWYMAASGPALVQRVSGNFRLTTSVRTRSLVSPGHPPGQGYHYGGIIARNPSSDQAGAAENYVFNAVGRNYDRLTIEYKSTRNDQSERASPSWPSGDAELRLCRIGATFHLYYRPIGGSSWALLRTVERTDLPAELQTGVLAYAWTGQPDLRASFDYVRYGSVAGQADCTAADAPGGGTDSAPPTAPTSLTATPVSASRVDLRWGAASDNVLVAGYRVERCLGASCTAFQQVAAPSGTSHADTTAQPSSTYRYRVRAADSSGNLGPYAGPVSATTPSAPPPSSGPAAAYGFSEGTGTTTADASGNGNRGTLLGGTAWTTGRFGAGLSFDGSDDHVSVPDSATLDVVAPMTVSAWVLNQDPAHSWERILSKKSSWSATSGWEITLADPKQLPGGVAILGSGPTTARIPCVTDWRTTNLGQWVHVAVVFSPPGTVTVFCNGASRGSGAIDPVAPSSHPLLIGRTSGETDKHWRGRIDEVRVYGRALTQAEIQAHMNTPVSH